MPGDEQQRGDPDTIPLADRDGAGGRSAAGDPGTGAGTGLDPEPEPAGGPSDPSHLALPYLLPACVLLGLGLGWAVDAAQGTGPLWLITCLVGFVLVGLYLVVRETFR